MDFRMSGQIGLRFLALMRTCSIPDQYDPTGHMTLHMLDGCNHLVTLDGAFKMTLEDLTRHCQSYCRRQNPPIPHHSPQDGSFAFPRPGWRQWFQVRKAKFIEEHDDCAEMQRLFLSLASPFPAKPSPVPRHARPHAAVASERCSPTGPALAREHSGDSLCQIPS
jgi:hypothetical protein